MCGLLIECEAFSQSRKIVLASVKVQAVPGWSSSLSGGARRARANWADRGVLGSGVSNLRRMCHEILRISDEPLPCDCPRGIATEKLK